MLSVKKICLFFIQRGRTSSNDMNEFIQHSVVNIYRLAHQNMTVFKYHYLFSQHDPQICGRLENRDVQSCDVSEKARSVAQIPLIVQILSFHTFTCFIFQFISHTLTVSCQLAPHRFYSDILHIQFGVSGSALCDSFLHECCFF